MSRHPSTTENRGTQPTELINPSATAPRQKAKRTTSKKAKSRVYYRERGGERRYYGDFRNVGGGREPLVGPGDTLATTDPVIAETLAAERLAVLHKGRQDRVTTKRKGKAILGEFVALHLIETATSGTFSESWLADTERMLSTIAIEHFGADRDLATIEVDDIQENG